MRGTRQKLTRRGEVRCRPEIVDYVGDDKDKRRHYPNSGFDEEQGRGERVEQCQTRPVRSADGVSPAIFPEKATLEQYARMIDPAYQQARCP